MRLRHPALPDFPVRHNQEKRMRNGRVRNAAGMMKVPGVIFMGGIFLG